MTCPCQLPALPNSRLGLCKHCTEIDRRTKNRARVKAKYDQAMAARPAPGIRYCRCGCGRQVTRPGKQYIWATLECKTKARYNKRMQKPTAFQKAGKDRCLPMPKQLSKARDKYFGSTKEVAGPVLVDDPIRVAEMLERARRERICLPGLRETL